MEGYVIVFVTILIATAVSCDLVDYYEKLIEEGIRNAETYQFPKDAGGYRPVGGGEIEDAGDYDFVVVGAGSAGAVAASRLSEVSGWRILLLEAGKPGNNFTEVPAMSPYTAMSDYNWGFNSTPQTECCQDMGGICPYPRGRSLGGTSTINALIYARGNRADYDRWASLGNPDWSYKKVLPYFIKSENSEVEGDAGYHGFGGYLNVEHHFPQSKKVDVFLTGHQELGRPLTDVNGKRQLGASGNNFNTINGRRHSTEKAFLQPSLSRSNLHVLTESYVEKIVVERRTKSVTGVLFSRNNTRYFVRVGKEVVLSAGVIGSPHILMHSGIGPKQHLHDLNIPVVNDLQVGLNMHDHLTFYSMYISTKIPDTQYTLRESISQYLNGTGPLTISTNPQGISFFQLVPDNFTAPDFELVFVPSVDTKSFAAPRSGILHGFVEHFKKQSSNEEYRLAQFVLILLHPKTRGRIYLESNDPFVYPLIDSKCLSDPDNVDLETLYGGIKKVVELIDTEAFKEAGAELLREPRCEAHEFKSREYWLCVVRLMAMNAYHGSGTCQMGPDPRKGGVVDGKLKVHGVHKLRVADTSVVPVTISGHMNAPAMMIGERVADFIKMDYLR